MDSKEQEMRVYVERLEREVAFLKKCIPTVEFHDYVDNMEKEHRNILRMLEGVALPTETSYRETLTRIVAASNEKAF